MKVRAFQVKDYKSIQDSRICTLSGDNITILAGQNEAGKSNLLLALRDFDAEPGAPPKTEDYMPDGRFDARPMVRVQFELERQDLNELDARENPYLPPAVLDRITQNPLVWITRDMLEHILMLDSDFQAVWPKEEPADTAKENEEKGGEEGEEKDEDVNQPMNPSEFIDFLRERWPRFIYFNAFDDILPRSVPAASINDPSDPRLQIVRDFVTLSRLNLDVLDRLKEQDKHLNNYLRDRSAVISGDFLDYWDQKVDDVYRVDLKVMHHRDTAGNLRLAFYIFDGKDIYPGQRSKGFLWFLSFYLRLAAEQLQNPTRNRFLLIDEPASYLHAKAQEDVLRLMEDRLARQDHITYATHSPFLISANRLNRVRVVINKSNEGTLICDRLTHPDLRGETFAESLTPIMTAIGLDATRSLAFAREDNILLEGISDYYYISGLADIVDPDFNKDYHLIPGTSATKVPFLASIFIGWGLNFVVLLDRDETGNEIRRQLLDDLDLPDQRVLQHQDAITVEDLLSPEDFRSLLDEDLDLQPGQRPSEAIARQNVQKVFLARRFKDRCSSGEAKLTDKTRRNAQRAIAALRNALSQGQ